MPGLNHRSAAPSLAIEPAEAVLRRRIEGHGVVVETLRFRPTEVLSGGSDLEHWHLLMACTAGEKRDGETWVDGLPPSALRHIGGKLTLVPAGRRHGGDFVPKVLPQMVCVYLDPALPLIGGARGPGRDELKPRLFFEDAAIWATVRKLGALVDGWSEGGRLYAELLSATLAVELMRLQQAPVPPASQFRGGLAARQQRLACEHIEAHLAEDVSLAELAALTGLSSSHFIRAFKRTMGVPPHRYQLQRRIDRAKELLSDPGLSVGAVARACGFLHPSTFSEAFRRHAGMSPLTYRRSLA